jgi:hypothetical protein
MLTLPSRWAPFSATILTTQEPVNVSHFLGRFTPAQATTSEYDKGKGNDVMEPIIDRPQSFSPATLLIDRPFTFITTTLCTAIALMSFQYQAIAQLPSTEYRENRQNPGLEISF